MSQPFAGQVAIVTGAGNGLGRSHALALAELGARVVVNDLGGSRDGSGGSSDAAKEVVELIKQRGGDAIANGANVTDYTQVEAMVQQAMDAWGRVDILVNNAGILRDKTFSKMSIDDFKLVVDVHLMGSVNCTKAVWEIMRAQEYGRIVMTTSASGLYGNFGQSNYSAAKMAVVGLMNTLVLEGAKSNIKVNCLAPAAGTRMTEELMPPELYKLMSPEAVTAGLLTLVGQNAPNRKILCAGAGAFASTEILECEGVYLPPEEQRLEVVESKASEIYGNAGAKELHSAGDQSMKFALKAMKHFNIPVPNGQ